MTGTAVFYLILAIIVVWGGLLASSEFLVLRSEVPQWPAPDIPDAEETQDTD
jgi:hypothetical protein